MKGENDQADLTLLLQGALEGDKQAESRFCRAVYDELHRAARRIVRDPAGSLHASALVNELFLKMFRRSGLKNNHGRRYFYAVAIDQMRKLLIDHHRVRQRQKAGGDRKRVSLDKNMGQVIDEFEKQNGCDVEALETALAKLEATNQRAHSVVIHRFYGGLTYARIAEMLGVSVSTVESDWRLARAKLARFLAEHA